MRHTETRKRGLHSAQPVSCAHRLRGSVRHRHLARGLLLTSGSLLELRNTLCSHTGAVSLCAAAPDRSRPAAPDRGRAGDPRSAAPVGGRDNAAPLRAGGAARTAAALTPRPRINLLLYYGVLGARLAWRSRLRRVSPKQRPPGTGARRPSSRRRALRRSLLHHIHKPRSLGDRRTASSV